MQRRLVLSAHRGNSKQTQPLTMKRRMPTPSPFLSLMAKVAAIALASPSMLPMYMKQHKIKTSALSSPKGTVRYAPSQRTPRRDRISARLLPQRMSMAIRSAIRSTLMTPMHPHLALTAHRGNSKQTQPLTMKRRTSIRCRSGSVMAIPSVILLSLILLPSPSTL